MNIGEMMEFRLSGDWRNGLGEKYMGTSKNIKPIGLLCKEMVYHIR